MILLNKVSPASLWMVMVESQTGAVGCVPLRGKGQIKLATSEVMACTQGLGYHSVCFHIDNEPAVRKILRALLNARHALGLPTQIALPQQNPTTMATVLQRMQFNEYVVSLAL